MITKKEFDILFNQGFCVTGMSKTLKQEKVSVVEDFRDYLFTKLFSKDQDLEEYFNVDLVMQALGLLLIHSDIKFRSFVSNDKVIKLGTEMLKRGNKKIKV